MTDEISKALLHCLFIANGRDLWSVGEISEHVSNSWLNIGC